MLIQRKNNLCQSSQNGKDAKTIGASYMVSVRTSNEEGATEEIVGSNPTSDTKKLKPTGSGTTCRKLLKCTEERFME